MKPRNKYEERVNKLSKKLKPLGKRIQNYSINEGFEYYAMTSRNRLHCLECGEKWTDGLKSQAHIILKTAKCPGCNKKVTLIENKSYSKFETYSIHFDTIEEFQIIRTLYTEKVMVKNKKAKFYHTEIIQRWINTNNGKKTIRAVTSGGMFSYYITWNGKTLEIKNDNNKYTSSWNSIYPKMKIHPLLKRNGFNNDLQKAIPEEIFVKLIKYPNFETLWKQKQYRLFRKIQTNDEIKKYWGQIKIAQKNNYSISDVTDWIDYINLLSFFNKDILNKKYVCPISLEKEHNKYVERKRKHNAKIAYEEQKKQIAEDQKLYKKEKGKYFKLKFTKKDITIKPIKTVKDFLLIGETLNHCIYQSSYYTKSNSLILAVYINKKVVETVEVSLNKNIILQSRGINNLDTKWTKEVKTLVERNINKIMKLSA